MQTTLKRNTGITKIERLHDLAAENNIQIDESCPPSIISMSVKLPNNLRIIGLSDDELTEHTRLEQFAHEMGHCMTDSFYMGYSPFELRAKHENKANEWAIKEVVPFPELCEAVRCGCRELWELAEHFNVSCGFIEKAIRIHEQNGNTVPKELYEECFS